VEVDGWSEGVLMKLVGSCDLEIPRFPVRFDLHKAKPIMKHFYCVLDASKVVDPDLWVANKLEKLERAHPMASMVVWMRQKPVEVYEHGMKYWFTRFVVTWGDGSQFGRKHGGS
jgi:hypothetical protein